MSFDSSQTTCLFLRADRHSLRFLDIRGKILVSECLFLRIGSLYWINSIWGYLLSLPSHKQKFLRMVKPGGPLFSG